MSFSYYTPFVVDHTKCGSSNSTNFPVPIRVLNDARFKSVANGGHVQSSSGFDIRPFSDVGLSSAMTFELVPGSYDAVNGSFVMFVLMPTLDVAADMTIYLGYGDATVVTDGSSSSTWNSGFKGVWHFPNGTTLTALDSTSNANNGTINSATAAAGSFDGGASFNGTTADVTVGTGASLNITTLPITVETFFKKNANGTIGPLFAKRIGGGGGYVVAVRNAGVDLYLTKASVVDIVFPSVIPNNTNFHYAGIVSDSTSARAHVNPTTNSPTNTQANTANIATNGNTARVGYDQENTDRWTGIVDELRISNVVRSGDWMLATYNGLSSPTTFSVIGSEVATGAAPATVTMGLAPAINPVPRRPGPGGLTGGKPFTQSADNPVPLAIVAVDTPPPFVMMIPMRPGPGGFRARSRTAVGIGATSPPVPLAPETSTSTSSRLNLGIGIGL